MKTTNLFASILLLASTLIWGQADTIVYDFQSKQLYKEFSEGSKITKSKYSTKLTVTYNKPYYFKIKNINRYVYGIDVSQKNIEFASKPSELFTTYFGKGIYALDGTGSLSTNVNARINAFVDNFKTYEDVYRKVKLGFSAPILKDSKFKEDNLIDFINNFRLIKKNMPKDPALVDELAQIEFDQITEEYIIEIVKCIYFSLEKNTVLRSYQLYPKGNIVSYDIIFTKYGLNQKEEKVEIEKGSTSFDLFVKNKPFISFSTGPFLGIHNNFKTKKYSWKPISISNVVPEDPKYQLIESAQSGSPFGVAAFANIGMKTTNFFGLAATIGAGATTESSPKIAYFAGLSALIGNQKQFNITGGWSFIQTETLKYDLYNDIGILQYTTKPADIEYSKNFKGGWFLSLSYTLFSTESKETKITASPAFNKSENK